MRMKEMKASITVEMSVLVPLILFMIMGLILSVFYFHDKNILNGAAYETAVVGSMRMRETEEITEAELVGFCRERVKGKCIFLTSQQIDISMESENVLVEIIARKSGFAVSVQKKAAVTNPEEKIRNIRRFDINNGAKNND